MAADKYREYFDLDDAYFPQINETTIEKANWENTYPHYTFIKLLNSVVAMLDSKTHRSVWIHGSYGTGKSQCAFALKKILEVSESDLTAYWSRPTDPLWPLNKTPNPDLLKKLNGIKQRKIVTAYRYGSGGISSTVQLLLAVQESVKKALIEQSISYYGENTLKDAVIAWIEDPYHKRMFDDLLENKYTSWPQANSDEVLAALRKGGQIVQLMDNIFDLANAEGITALTLTTERLVAWIKDVIKNNENLKIVLVWDEFSAYFKNNRNSLDQFQKLAELCDSNFYFIIVTHETGGLINANDKTWEIVKQRFDFAEIILEESIAFKLISHARKVKQTEEIKKKWDELAKNLASYITNSCREVTNAVKVDADTIKGLLPLHPMAALVLKNIASSFQSNQRSIFDFMSLDKDDVHGFQWFLTNTTPEDDNPLLTIDQLWNFFYEHGKENLTVDIRSILDTFPRQNGLSAKEQTVLKTILIMQAISHRIGGGTGEMTKLFLVTDKNLDLVFEGNRDLEGGAAINIAKKLVNDGVLFNKPIGNGVEVYAAAQTMANQTTINHLKEEIRKTILIAKLVSEGGLADVLQLTPPLKLRYELKTDPNKGKLTTVTSGDFTSTMNKLRNSTVGWKFKAVIAFALDDADAASFRKTIQVAAANPDYADIVIIDALATPLGSDDLEQYIDHSAMSLYYSGNDPAQASNNSRKATRILDSNWKNRIYDGAFIVYSALDRQGARFAKVNGVLSALQDVVTSKYKDVFDFTKGLTENMLKQSQLSLSVQYGATQMSGQSVSGIERLHFLVNVWNVDKYWEKQPTLAISRIKIALEEKIEAAFARDGQISTRELYDELETTFGFAPCNMSAFLAGFLLKEYAGEPYRYFDTQNCHDSMSPLKLKEMLGNYINNMKSNYKDTYIVKMTQEERAFYALTEKAWGIAPNTCGTAGRAALAVGDKMRGLGLPVWCLAEVDKNGVYEYVEKFIELVQKEGKEAHQKAIEIGKIAMGKPTLGDALSSLFTKSNCQEGMRKFLSHFESGQILNLAKKIGTEISLIDDVLGLFDVPNSNLWNKTLGENEIRKLLTSYGFIHESNAILATNPNSLQKCYSHWRDKLKAVPISEEQLKEKIPTLAKLFSFLSKVATQAEILPEQLNAFLTDLKKNEVALSDFFKDGYKVFIDVYSPYLEGLSDDDIAEVKGKLPMGMFTLSATECNAKVKTHAESYRQGKIKTKLILLWKDKSNTRTPHEWSRTHKIPILCLISREEFDMTKKTFETLNRSNPTDSEVKEALAFLETEPKFLSDINDDTNRKTAFIKGVIGKYAKILTDISKVQDALNELSIEPYEWFNHPRVSDKIKQLAEAEYNSGGSDVAFRIIDGMDDATLKDYLKRLVKDNMTVGLEIIDEGDN
jgi:hypothetical protein